MMPLFWNTSNDLNISHTHSTSDDSDHLKILPYLEPKSVSLEVLLLFKMLNLKSSRKMQLYIHMIALQISGHGYHITQVISFPEYLLFLSTHCLNDMAYPHWLLYVSSLFNLSTSVPLRDPLEQGGNEAIAVVFLDIYVLSYNLESYSLFFGSLITPLVKCVLTAT